MSTQKHKPSEKSQAPLAFEPGVFERALEKQKAKEIAEGARRVDKHGNPVMVPHEPVDF